MSYIGNTLQIAYPSYTNIDDISSSFNGVTTSFALTVGGVAPVPAPLSSNQCMISVGGVIQRPDDTGTEGFRLSGGNIVFSSAPNTGEDFFGVILAGADYVNVGVNYPSGTASTPSITFDSDLDTGLYNPAANELGITTGGTSRLVVDSSGNVNIDSNTLYVDAVNNRVGVGTTSPGKTLEVSNSATEGGIRVRTTTTNVGDESRIEFAQNGQGAGSNIVGVIRGLSAASNGGELAFNTVASGSGSEALRIDSSGRLLVGTSTARANFFNSTYTAREQVEGTGATGADRGALAVINNSSGDDAPLLILAKSKGTTIGSNTLCTNNEYVGHIAFQANDGSEFIELANIIAQVDGTSGADDMPGRLVFSTTRDGASSPTERMRIRSDGYINAGNYLGTAYHRFNGIDDVQGDTLLTISGYQASGGSNQDTAIFYAVSSPTAPNAAASAIKVFRNSGTNRSINAAGTINASGADYAEYMVKAGSFTIAKGDVCGVNAEGKLTNVFANSVSFLVKSTDPSYVGGDTWHLNAGEEPGGYNDDRTEDEITAAKAIYEQHLEDARQKVDRIAFAGQVPVNVIGATPGQYIVPVEAADGGIEGIAKNEADLTLTEYMRAVGKVIAIEDDGRARIIVKVA